MNTGTHTQRNRSAAPLGITLLLALLLVAAAPADFVSDALSHAPDDTAVLLVIPNMGVLNGQVANFLSACGVDVQQEMSSGSVLELLGLVDVETVLSSGANLDGGFVIFLSRNMNTMGWACELTDPGAFRQLVSSESYAERIAAGTDYWVDAYEAPGQQPVITSATTIVDGFALGTNSEEGLIDAIATTTPPALAASVGEPAQDSARIIIDLAGLINANQAQIDQVFQMMTMMATMAPPQPGVDMAAIMNMYTEMGQKMLRVGRDTEALVLTLSPNASAMLAECNLVLRQDSQYIESFSRHIDSDLDLRASVPSDAAVTVVSTFDNARDPELFAGMATLFGQAMAGQNQETLDAFQRLSDLTVEAYSSISDQIAFSVAAGEGVSIIPQTLIIMRTSNPTQTRDLMVQTVLDPATAIMMDGMYGSPSPEPRVSATDEGISTISGHEVRQIILSGLGSSMREMMTATYGATLPPETETMIEQMDSVTYWYAATDDSVIITTEDEPNLLRQVLNGEVGGLAPPAFAQPIMQGVDAMAHISIRGLVGFMASSMAMSGMPTGMNPFAPLEQAFANGEDGVWGSLTMTDRGVRGAVAVPSADIRRISNAVQSMQQQPMM